MNLTTDENDAGKKMQETEKKTKKKTDITNFLNEN